MDENAELAAARRALEANEHLEAWRTQRVIAERRDDPDKNAEVWLGNILEQIDGLDGVSELPSSPKEKSFRALGDVVTIGTFDPVEMLHGNYYRRSDGMPMTGFITVRPEHEVSALTYLIGVDGYLYKQSAPYYHQVTSSQCGSDMQAKVLSYTQMRVDNLLERNAELQDSQ